MNKKDSVGYTLWRLLILVAILVTFLQFVLLKDDLQAIRAGMLCAFNIYILNHLERGW